MSRIVEAVRTAELSPEMAEVRDTALRTWDLRGRPAVAETQADQPSVVDEQPQESVVVDSRRAPAPAAPSTGPVLELEIPVRVRISLGDVTEVRRSS